MESIKILFIGPLRSGKTRISDFLCQSGKFEINSENDDKLYDPTVGCRILENRFGGVRVQVWDVSGDNKYERGWPAIMQDSHGIVLIYNPNDLTQESESELWYETFMKKSKVPKDNCIVLLHEESTISSRSKSDLKFAGCQVVNTTFSRSRDLSTVFNDFILRVSRNSGKKNRS